MQPLSIRFERAVRERLQQRARTSGMSPSALAQRFVDEGLRMTEHPGIVFRDGPTGRRAGLATGPDVWEVISALQHQDERGEKAVRAVVEATGLSDRQVWAAIGYFAAHEDEIRRRIEDNRRAAEDAEAAWEAQQRLLA